MATEAKPKPRQTKKSEVEEQIEVFEPVAKAVDRELTHPDTGEKKTFVQHELSFMPKLKFFRLLSGTFRLAAESDADSNGAGMANFLEETLSNISNFQENPTITNDLIATFMKLIELVPDFAEELYILALNVKPKDSVWTAEALQNIDDDLGIDILEVFIAQNGKAMRDFFAKRLAKVGKRLTVELTEDMEELETTP